MGNIINVLSCSQVTVSGSALTNVLGVNIPNGYSGLLEVNVFAQDSNNAGNVFSCVSFCNVNASGSVPTVQSVTSSVFQPTMTLERLQSSSFTTVGNDVRVNFSGSTVQQFSVLTRVSGLLAPVTVTPY